jgi:hypothetical protein
MLPLYHCNGAAQHLTNNNMKRIDCIEVQGIKHKMVLLTSDLVGFYLYKLIPIELGYESKIMYIAPNREAHWMYGKPMDGGKQIKHSEILYFNIFK